MRSPPAPGSGSRPSARAAFSSCGAAARRTRGPTAARWGRPAPGPSAWPCAVRRGRRRGWARRGCGDCRPVFPPADLARRRGAWRGRGRTTPLRPLTPRLRRRALGVDAPRAPVGARPRRGRRHVRVHRVGGRGPGMLGARRPPAETRRSRPRATGRSGPFPSSLAPGCSAPGSGRPRPVGASSASPRTGPAHSPSSQFSGTVLRPGAESRKVPLLGPHPFAAHPSAHLSGPNLPGTYSGPTLNLEPSPEAAPASLAPPSPPGKKHILMLSLLRAEDAGEVRFQAGPAQSSALLEVEGKLLRRGRQGLTDRG